MNPPEDIVRTASVQWEGDVAKGHGGITVGSGKIAAAYSFGTRFSGDPGTNPEELLGAAHAACFTMALSGALTRAGHPPVSIATTASVHLRKGDAGFGIPQIELVTKVVAAGITDADFQKLATGAKEGCPISKALAAVPMTLTATLSAP